MAPVQYSYDLFLRFIEKFAPLGYEGIDPDDPLVLEIERLTQKNDQFALVGDTIQAKILWASSRSLEMVGVNPGQLNPYHFFDATHPDDIKRHGNGRSKMFTLANDLFIAEQGHAVLSTNLKMRNLHGYYHDLLFQLYVFYSRLPVKSVYLLQVLTNIESSQKKKYRHHYYVGNNMGNFRFPDKELLDLGEPYTEREFEIIQLIKSGFRSEQIAEKLFLSIHTINTHRKNILAKSGMKQMSDLIEDLMTRRVL